MGSIILQGGLKDSAKVRQIQKRIQQKVKHFRRFNRIQQKVNHFGRFNRGFSKKSVILVDSIDSAEFTISNMLQIKNGSAFSCDSN